MPFYEYTAVNLDQSCELCRKVFEEMQPITSDALTSCPMCGSPVKRIVSLIAGAVFKGRQANQYNDIMKAKYWRDKNGVKHRVTPGDGSVSSASVNRKTLSDEQIKANRQREQAAAKQKRMRDSFGRYVKYIKK